MLISSFFAVATGLSKISEIVSVQAVSLFSGSDASIHQKMKSHLSIVVSSSPASANSFVRATISSLGIGSKRSFARAAMWIASRMFEPGMPTVTPILAST